MTVSITIEAVSAAQLKQELLVLALAHVSVNPTTPGVSDPALMPGGQVVTEDTAEAPAEEKPKRTRRTKAQIAAEKAAAEAETVEAPSEDETPAPTLHDVNLAMAALMETGASGGGKMIDLLTELGAKDESGAIKTKFLSEDKFAEAIEKAKVLTTGAEKADESTENVLG